MKKSGNLSYAPRIFDPHMSLLTFGSNELRKMPYFPQLLSCPSGAIFGGTNNEITNTMTKYIHLFCPVVERLMGRLERIKHKIGRSNVSVLFNQTYLKEKMLPIYI